MSDFRHDLKNSEFVKSSGNTVSVLYKHYMNDVSYLLNKYAPLVTRTFTKEFAGWLSDPYWRARALNCQHKHIWSSNKNGIAPDYTSTSQGVIHTCE